MNVIIKIKKIYKISAIVFIYKKIPLADLKIEKESKKINVITKYTTNRKKWNCNRT